MEIFRANEATLIASELIPTRLFIDFSTIIIHRKICIFRPRIENLKTDWTIAIALRFSSVVFWKSLKIWAFQMSFHAYCLAIVLFSTARYRTVCNTLKIIFNWINLSLGNFFSINRIHKSLLQLGLLYPFFLFFSIGITY